MIPTNATRRRELVAWLDEYARDTLTEWMRKGLSGPGEDDQYRLTWHEDGSAVLEDAYGRAVLRLELDLGFRVVEADALPESRPWGEVPAGWEVQAKQDGPWYRVLATRDAGRVQEVTLDLSGRPATFERDPAATVTARPGPDGPGPWDALAGSRIMEDQVS